MLNKDYLEIGSDIIGAAFEVRKCSNRFMRERYYEAALVYELEKRGYKVERQVTIPALYKGLQIEDSYQADIIVNEKVIIELKAITVMREEDCRQLLSYLKLSGLKLGYLINFGSRDFRIGKTSDDLPYLQGIYRFVNNL